MKILIKTNDKGLQKACQDIGRLFFPSGEFLEENDQNPDITVTISSEEGTEGINGKAVLKDSAKEIVKEVNEEVISGTEGYNQAKRVARLAWLKALEEYTGQTAGPWGILTGIRPTKIVHRLLDENWSDEEIKKHLSKDYVLEKTKAELLLEVAKRERQYLLDIKGAGELISVYIGIPFCPTRCAYCSFPAYGVESAGKFIEPFVKALTFEITSLGEYLQARGIKVQTIYIGGGTPTALSGNQLKTLLEAINNSLKSEATVEFTVEAGRPDTLNPEKLAIMKSAGVTRISINPQTMHAETLEKIGRKHLPTDTVDAMDMAREAGFENINMDLIVGLPGESIDHIRETIKYVSMLKPESITLHTLAVKRASEIKENRTKFDLPDKEQVQGMFDTAIYMVRMMAMHPYYMYRQKHMVSPLENIGFAIEGYHCLYNIQMIEERQTIVGLGAGAGSKFVNPVDWTLESFYNPKEPQNYIERIEELWTKKVNGLDKVFAR